MFNFTRLFKEGWIGKRSKPCHKGTLTEKDLQQHLVNNFRYNGISDRRMAKEVLDCIENYFISARRDNLNAVWYGWFTQACFRTESGMARVKMKWHKPFRHMLRGIK